MKPKQATLLAEKIESLPMEQTPRMHLGASEIGTECTRALWYSFRWVTYSNFPNRMLRLFNRGHEKENAFEKLFKELGCTVLTKDAITGEQFHIDKEHDGHYGGSLDGVILGIPDMPDEWLLLEMKTSEYKTFRQLYGYNGKIRKYDKSLGKSVKEIHPKHYAQMQTYMHKKGLRFALYCVVNKNDDMLYFEIVPYDPSCIPALEEKVRVAIYSKQAPKKISNNPSAFKCQFCNHKGVCQLNETPEMNCRTCRNIVMLDQGRWQCALTNELKNKKGLLDGCDRYELNRAIA